MAEFWICVAVPELYLKLSMNIFPVGDDEILEAMSL